MRVQIEATEPEELLAFPTPDGITVRREDNERFPTMSVSGPRDALRAFITDHWGEEVAQHVVPLSWVRRWAARLRRWL